MAIMDADLVLGSALAVTSSPVRSTVLDMKAASRDVGKGNPMKLVIKVGTAFASGTDITFDLETDTVVGMGSAVKKLTVPAVLLASLTAGAKILEVDLPVGLKQFISVLATPNGAFSAGTLNIYIVVDDGNWAALPGNVGS